MDHNLDLLAIIREKEKLMTEMRDHMKKQDYSILSYTQKDLTLQIMNIKVEEINAFFLQLLKKLALQQEREKDAYKKQFASVGETIKDSIMKDPNLLTKLKLSQGDRSKCRLASAPNFRRIRNDCQPSLRYRFQASS